MGVPTSRNYIIITIVCNIKSTDVKKKYLTFYSYISVLKDKTLPKTKHWVSIYCYNLFDWRFAAVSKWTQITRVLKYGDHDVFDGI